mgnify:CR=1 FL=1
MPPVIIIASKEFRDGLRHRWVVAIAFILALFATGIAAFGAVASGGLGFTALSTTLASLTTLAVVLIPLIALMLAYDAIVGEQENGTLLLLLTYPLPRSRLLLGKFLGHAAVLGIATLIGFGVATAVIAVAQGDASIAALFAGMGRLIGAACLLGWAFLAMAYLISTSVQEKARAAGLALITWFFFVLVFDLGLLALLVGIRQGGDWLPWLMLANPVECFRLLMLGGVDNGHELGLTVLGQAGGFSTPLLAATLAAWIVIPLALAIRRFQRRPH